MTPRVHRGHYRVVCGRCGAVVKDCGHPHLADTVMAALGHLTEVGWCPACPPVESTP